MRISTAYIHFQGVQNMLQQQAKLAEVSDQLAKGVKNLAPSDDPSAASRVLNLNEAISQMTQYEENAGYATQRLSLEESTLDSVSKVLDRVKELSVQAANTAVNDLGSERAIAAEIRERLDELYDYANTRDASGEYLFSGFQSGTQPFTTDGIGQYFYNGDQGQIALQVGSNRQVVSNDSGADVFQMIRTGNGDFSVDASSTNGGTGIISTGSVVNPALFQSQDFSIVFSENQPTASRYALNVSALSSFDFSTEQVSFDVDATTVTLNADVTDAAGLANAIATALGTANYTVTETGGTINIATTATGIGSTAPVISNYNGDVDGNAVVATAGVYTATNALPLIGALNFSAGFNVGFNVDDGTDNFTVALTADYSGDADYTNFLNDINTQLSTNLVNATASVVAGNLVFTDNSGATGAGSAAPIISAINLDPDGGAVFATDFLIGAGAAGAPATGTLADFVSAGVTTAGINALATPSKFTYDVINKTTGATVLSAQTYTDGGVIAFNGINVDIQGEPVAGDVFSVNASRNQDMFTTLYNLAETLENPGTGDLRGVLGGDYINNGFSAGDTVAFDLNFDGKAINFSVALPASPPAPLPTNADVANQMMATLAATPSMLANADGSYTLPGSTAGNSVTFKRVGDNIEFITSGGTLDKSNTLVLNNLSDTTGNAVLSISASGNSVASQATLSAAVVGDSATYLKGEPPRSHLSQQIANALDNMAKAMDSVLNIRTSIGGRMNSIDGQLSENAARQEHLQTIRSEIRDLDFAEAISNLTFQTTALQAAQQTFVRVQNLSLFNYI